MNTVIEKNEVTKRLCLHIHNIDILGHSEIQFVTNFLK